MKSFARYFLGFVDQGVLSLSSIIFLVLAAQFSSPTELGAFVLGLSTAVLIQSLVRALTGETLLVRSTHNDFGPDEAQKCLGIVVSIAALIALTVMLLGFVLPDQLSFFFSLAITQFGLLLQDGMRFAALAKNSTYGLLAVDMAYAAATSGAILAAGLAGLDASGLLIALGAAATLVGVVGGLVYRILPSFAGCVAWTLSHWRLNSSFVSEAIIGAAVGYTITLILNFVVSAAELAAYRSVLSIFGLTSLAINFLRTIVLRDLRGNSLRKARSFWLKSLIMAVLVAATVGATFLVLVSLPTSIGTQLFGPTWPLMTFMFAATAANRFFAGLSVVPTVFLRVQGITWRATTIRISVTFIGFGLGPVGAVVAGARGALIGEALLYLILTVALFALSRSVAVRGRHRRERRSRRSEPERVSA